MQVLPEVSRHLTEFPTSPRSPFRDCYTPTLAGCTICLHLAANTQDSLVALLARQLMSVLTCRYHNRRPEVGPCAKIPFV